MRTGRYRKMSACRESHDADARRIESPFGGMRSQCAYRSLRIPQLDRMVVPRPKPVAQNERRDAERVQKSCDLASFMICRERNVSTARAHHDRGRVRRDGPRQIDREGWDIRLVGPQRSRSRAGPQRNRLSIPYRQRRLRNLRQTKHEE
jgi:hypothetical protein